MLEREPICDDGRRFGPNCGLITEVLTSLRFRRAFQQKRCAGLTIAECRRRYLATIALALQQRYPDADPRAVSENCQMPDADCQDLVHYELVVMDTHNAAVSNWAATRQLDIERKRKAGQQAYAQKLDHALWTSLYLISTDPKCVPHQGMGDTTLTFCSR